MKIVHVLSGLTKGGAEKVTVDLANFSAARGHEVSIIAATQADPSLLQHAIAPNVQLLFVSAAAAKLRVYAQVIPWILRRRHWLLAQDIVHCHLTFGGVFGTVLKAVRALSGSSKPRIVETYHAVGTPIPAVDRWLHARLASARDGFVLMARDDFWDDFVARHKSIRSDVVPNGAAFDPTPPPRSLRADYRKRAGIPEGRLVVGTVGRIVPARRPALFIAIFSEISRQLDVDVHFLMAGEGSELETTRRLGAEAGIGDRMHFPGLVQQPALAYSNIDLYLSLNVGAISGIAALEAAMFGLPVISAQLRPGHVRSAADWIWSSADPVEVAVEAIRLLRSPDERARLAREQQAQALAHHSVEAMGTRYESFYNEVLDASGD